MDKLSQKGFAHIVVILILLAGLAAALYLVQNRTNILPKAGGGAPATPKTSFTLYTAKHTVNIGDEVAVNLTFRSDITASNLFSAKITYDRDLLEFKSVEEGTFIKNWVEKYTSEPGKISLVGGIPNPGFKTELGYGSPVMATLYYKALKAGTATISFDDTSAIYSNADNANILVGKEPATITIGQKTTSPQPSGTPSAGRPDLIATINVFVSTQSVGVGSSVRREATVITTVKNIGSAAAEVSVAGVSRTGRVANNWRLFTKSLMPGESYEAATMAHFLSPGEYVYKAKADAELQINEENENNNEHSVLITVPFPTSAPAPSASPTPVSTAVPVPATGDGNNDGKVNLQDLSILFSDHQKTGGFRVGIDMNGDGVINSYDYSLMRNLLIQKGVIKG